MSDLHRHQRRTALKSRALIHALYRQALEDAGEKIAQAQAELQGEIDRVGLQISGAVDSGISISEIAGLTGLSRQKLYELRQRQQGNLEDLDMRLLAQLAASGALTPSQLSAQLRVEESTVAQILRELEDEGAVRPLISFYEGGEETAHLKISASGEEKLERWMLTPEREPTRMCVYVALEEEEKEPLRAVAMDVFGPEWFAVLESETVRGQSAPELAFYVVAKDSEEAVAAARSRIGELRQLAKVQQRPAVVTAVAPADPLRSKLAQHSGVVDVFGTD
jgi:DNA-binding MarR family transcriptional regulator